MWRKNTVMATDGPVMARNGASGKLRWLDSGKNESWINTHHSQKGSGAQAQQWLQWALESSLTKHKRPRTPIVTQRHVASCFAQGPKAHRDVKKLPASEKNMFGQREVTQLVDNVWRRLKLLGPRAQKQCCLCGVRLVTSSKRFLRWLDMISRQPVGTLHVLNVDSEMFYLAVDPCRSWISVSLRTLIYSFGLVSVRSFGHVSFFSDAWDVGHWHTLGKVDHREASWDIYIYIYICIFTVYTHTHTYAYYSYINT